MVAINPGGPAATLEPGGDPRRESSFPDPVRLPGKVLNALSLDRVDADIERLALVNNVLAAGERQYGRAFTDRLNEPLAGAGQSHLVSIPFLYLRVSEERCVRRRRSSAGSSAAPSTPSFSSPATYGLSG